MTYRTSAHMTLLFRKSFVVNFIFVNEEDIQICETGKEEYMNVKFI